MRWLLPFLLSAAAFGQSSSCANISLGVNGNLNGFVPYPATDPWNTPVTNLPVDTATNTAFMGIFGPAHLHPDFGTVYGIPYNVVDTTTAPVVPITMTTYPDMSDIMPWPLSNATAVESAPGQCPDMNQDYHAIIIDKKTCFVYETWQTASCNGSWSASNGNVWDLTQSERRPYGMTSADAAGLSIFGGLLRYEEASSGQINHAIRFTVSQTKNNANGGLFQAPATHAAGVTWGSPAIIGMRMRLKSSFDVSSYSKINQTILTAMKTYGIVLADNGGTGFFQGTADSRWNDDDLDALKAVALTDFEVVATGATAYDETTAPTGPSPTINAFTATATTVPAGTPVVLAYSVVNDSYDFIDLVGPVRGPVVVTPTATTTYTLVSTNQFGRSTRQVTITVGDSSPSTGSSSPTGGASSPTGGTASPTGGTATPTGGTATPTGGTATQTGGTSTGSGSSTTGGAGTVVGGSTTVGTSTPTGGSTTTTGGADSTTGGASSTTISTGSTSASVTLPQILIPSTTSNLVFKLVVTVVPAK